MKTIPGLATARRALWIVARSPLVPNFKRAEVMRRLGLTKITDVTIAQNVTIVEPESLRGGPGCFINSEAFIDRGGVTLGSHVFIGPRAMIITAQHPIGSSEWRAADGAPQPVSIGDGCWIGAGAMILPGVTVGKGCVIAAGAVVNKDCEPDGLYAGVPARRIRDLPVEGDEAPAHG